MPPPHQRLRTAQRMSAYLPAPVVPDACKGLSVRLGSAAALLGLTSLFVRLVPALYAMPVPSAAAIAGVAGRCSKADQARCGFSTSEQCRLAEWSVCTVCGSKPSSRRVSQRDY